MMPLMIGCINLISAVGVVEVAQHVELIRLEGGAGLIDKVIRPRHLNGLAINRLR
jgi:hypothetical protein